jgi:protein-disulfide isomerase/uncharacterized membrane protein
MRTDNIYLKTVLLLALFGILVSGWLLYTHIKFSTGMAGLTEGCSLPGFGGSQGCADVAISEYSDIFGIPLAALAMGFYFAIAILVFWAMRNYQSAYEPLYVSFFLSTLSIIVTVIMFSISRFILQSFCIGCSLLWLVNLSIWPALVKHLNLGWPNALAGNLELLRHKNLRLRKDRILASFVTGGVCLLVFAVIGASAKGLQSQESRTGENSLINDYANGTQVFLPAEALGGNTSKGAEKPILDIVEFADFQCPGCKMASQFMRPFYLKHKDKVRITYRSFPLDGSCNSFVPNGGHRLACSAAKASICAGNEGKFWEMHDRIFDQQETLSATSFSEFAAELGINKEKFDACLVDPSTETALQKDIQWGDLIQLQSTPTVVINGRKTAGARTPSDLEGLLKHVEKEKSSAN